jgi:N,N'-diacetyllegionaminate synthase
MSTKKNFFLKKSKVYIIAEAGVNHNGKLKNAFRLIDIAVKAKVDAIKFQIFNPEKLCIPNAEQAKYQKKNFKDKNQVTMLKKLNLSKDNFLD